MHQNSFTGLRMNTHLLLLLLWPQQEAAMSPTPVLDVFQTFIDCVALFKSRRRGKKTSWGFLMVTIVCA